MKVPTLAELERGVPYVDLAHAGPAVLDATAADALMRVWRWADATDPARAAAGKAPGNTSAWVMLARCLGSVGDDAAALIAATTGLELAPRDSDLLRSQATALAALHRPEADAALAAYDRFRSPDDAAELRIVVRRRFAALRARARGRAHARAAPRALTREMLTASRFATVRLPTCSSRNPPVLWLACSSSRFRYRQGSRRRRRKADNRRPRDSSSNLPSESLRVVPATASVAVAYAVTVVPGNGFVACPNVSPTSPSCGQPSNELQRESVHAANTTVKAPTRSTRITRT